MIYKTKRVGRSQTTCTLCRRQRNVWVLFCLVFFNCNPKVKWSSDDQLTVQRNWGTNKGFQGFCLCLIILPQRRLPAHTWCCLLFGLWIPLVGLRKLLQLIWKMLNVEHWTFPNFCRLKTQTCSSVFCFCFLVVPVLCVVVNYGWRRSDGICLCCATAK